MFCLVCQVPFIGLLSPKDLQGYDREINGAPRVDQCNLVQESGLYCVLAVALFHHWEHPQIARLAILTPFGVIWEHSTM